MIDAQKEVTELRLGTGAGEPVATAAHAQHAQTVHGWHMEGEARVPVAWLAAVARAWRR